MTLQLENVLHVCGLLVRRYATRLDPEDAYQEAFMSIFEMMDHPDLDERFAYVIGKRRLNHMVERGATQRKYCVSEDLIVEPAASSQWARDPGKTVPLLLDIQEFLAAAGPRVQEIVAKRYHGDSISNADYQALAYARKRHGHILAA